MLTRGRRTALAHQQTLRATMDWSYDFLPEVDKVVLRRLAVFRGGFTMEAASSVVGDAGIRSFEVIEIIADLSQKSLVATDITYHYLLDTTRAYALEKLTESREREAIAGRHAEYYTTAIFLSALKAKWRRGLQVTGWPITLGKSTICAGRWTGPFRQMEMYRSEWR